MTVTQPPTKLVIDRSFLVPPPDCLMTFAPQFLFPVGKVWGVQGAEATKAITGMENCLVETQKWVNDEIENEKRDVH